VHPKLQSLLQSVPNDRSARIKLFGAAAVVVICAVWLGYFILSNLGGATYNPSSTPDSPLHSVAHELTMKLNEDIALKDVGFAVEPTTPPKLKVVGMVHSQADLDKVKAQLKVLRPEGDYEIDIFIQPR